MIWSPRVPVFRDDVSLALVEEVIPTNQPTLFDQVALVNMVTSCAVNLGHYKRQGGAGGRGGGQLSSLPATPLPAPLCWAKLGGDQSPYSHTCALIDNIGP